MCAPEGFYYFINHIKQRLVVLLDYNIQNGLDPCQSDIFLLRELYDLYDKGSIDTYSDTEVKVIIEQTSLFADDTLFGQPVRQTPAAQSLSNTETKTKDNEKV